MTDLRRAVLTEHASEQVEARGIKEAVVRSILGNPQRTISVRKGRVVVQGLISGEGMQYLLRVFVDVEGEPPEVVTVYRTSKIAKYGGAG